MLDLDELLSTSKEDSDGSDDVSASSNLKETEYEELVKKKARRRATARRARRSILIMTQTLHHRNTVNLDDYLDSETKIFPGNGNTKLLSRHYSYISPDNIVDETSKICLKSPRY